MKKRGNVDMFSVRCSNCALRKLGSYRDVSSQELAFIQELKKAHASHPPRSAIVHEHQRAGLATWLAAHEEGVVDDNLTTVGRRSSKEKVASLMMYFHRRSRASGMARQLGGLEAVLFPLTQHHIADALGLSLVHVNRTLRALRAMGLYETRDGWLVFPNPKALERLAAYFASPVTPRPLL